MRHVARFVKGPTNVDATKALLPVADNGRELIFHRARERVDNDALSFGVAEASVFAPTFSIPYGANTQL
jgi:hypothetical protein